MVSLTHEIDTSSPPSPSSPPTPSRTRAYGSDGAMTRHSHAHRRCCSHLNISNSSAQVHSLHSLLPPARRSGIYASLPHHYKASFEYSAYFEPSSPSSLSSQSSYSSPSLSPSSSAPSSNPATRSNSNSSRGCREDEIDENGISFTGKTAWNAVVPFPSVCSSGRVKVNLMKLWFKDLSDAQRNAFLREIVELCDASQIHTLSLLVENQLHRDCPPHCKDFAAWLPPHVCSTIFSYLDPSSLAKASQVSRLWREQAYDDGLWKKLCSVQGWQFVKGSVSAGNCSTWRQFFAMRWRVRRNWLSARCHIRTFEGHTHAVTCVQMDDTRIVSGSHDKTIKVWDVRTNSPWSVMTLVGHSGTVRCIQLLGGSGEGGSGPRLVSGSSDCTIKVWDLSMQPQWSAIACRVTMVGHTDTVRCLQADEEKVISGSYDSTLKVWCVKTGSCLRTLTGHQGRVLTIFFDKSDGTLVSGSDDCTIKVWKLDARDCLYTLGGHSDAVTSLTLTTVGSDGSGRRIISGSLDRTIKVWSLDTHECLSTLDWMNSEGHTGVIRCLQADAWRIISAADDKTLKMWSLESGRRLVTFRKHDDGVTCVQFNDFMMVSGSYDKSVKLWDFRVC